jgi:hypothetical protein
MYCYHTIEQFFYEFYILLQPYSVSYFSFPSLIIPPSEVYTPFAYPSLLAEPLMITPVSSTEEIIDIDIDMLAKKLMNQEEVIHLKDEIFYFLIGYRNALTEEVDSSEKNETIFDERYKWWNELDIVSLLPCSSSQQTLESSNIIDPFLLQRIVSLFILSSPTTTNESDETFIEDHISEISKVDSSPSKLDEEEDDDSSTLSSHSSSDSSSHKLHHDESESNLYDDIFKEVASEEGDSEKDDSSEDESQEKSSLFQDITKSSFDAIYDKRNHRFSLSGVEDDIFSPAVDNDPLMKLANRINSLLPQNVKNEETETIESTKKSQSDVPVTHHDYSISSTPFNGLLIPSIIRSLIFSSSSSHFSYAFISNLLCWIDKSIKLKDEDHLVSEEDTNLHPFSASNDLFPSQKHQLQEFENKKDESTSLFKRVLFSGKYSTEESGGNDKMEEEQRKKKEFILRKRKEFSSKSKLLLIFS